MKSLNVHETKTNLSAILMRIEQKGDSFVICRNGKPIADLVPHKGRSRLDVDPILAAVKIHCDLTAPITEEDWDVD
jgi:antitoxin (DNA-binding transcriptional repressor) of toxin-antitoxin stability system